MAAHRTALFGYATPNLGDDTQSLAAALFVGAPHALVDRDRLDEVRLPERHRLVMNSWFAIKRYEAVPRNCIDPVFFGFCVGRRELLNRKWLAYLERHQPIGCRDLTSVAWLQKHGIAAHMTGCLTMWMGQRIRPVPPQRRRGIYLVDVPVAAEPFIPSDILRDGIRLSNQPDGALQAAGLKARLRANALLLDKLRGAELVITRRLHVLLPCIGFGTPVVTFTAAKPPRMQKNWRFDGYECFARIVPLDALGAQRDVDWSDRRPSDIPPDLRARFDDFRARMGVTPEPVYESCAQAVEQLIPGTTISSPARSTRPMADWIGRTLSSAGLRAIPR